MLKVLCAELPTHLLEYVCVHVLRLAQPSEPHEDVYRRPFSRGTGPIGQAVVLAAVSKQWRHAAISAFHSLELIGRLAPDWSTPQQNLSPLLGQLIEGCEAVVLGYLQLRPPCPVAFLQAAKPALLVMCGPEADDAPCGPLHSCTALTKLRCFHAVPSSFPAGLRSLTVQLMDSSAVQPSAALVQSLRGLHSLTELTLKVSDGGFVLQRLPVLRSLQRLSVELSVGHHARDCKLLALQAAAERGVSTAVHVCFVEDDEFPTQIADRLQFWAAAARIKKLDQLQVSTRDLCGNFEGGPGEDHLLKKVQCEVLVLDRHMLCLPFTAGILRHIGYRMMHFHCLEAPGFSDTLQWQQLSARAGVYVLPVDGSLSITGCSGRLSREKAKPWALVIQQPRQGSVQGVPLEDFRPGPDGHLVWRNSAASDAHLRAAYSTLRARMQIKQGG